MRVWYGVSCLLWLARSPAAEVVFPGEHWETRTPEQAGLAVEKLEEFREVVGGRGCVVRGGYMVFAWGDQGKSSDVASAFKPVLSTLLLMAIQEGKIAGVDEPVARSEPRLTTLNEGKDAAITWRHLASQTSGYGWSERPGAAYGRRQGAGRGRCVGRRGAAGRPASTHGR